MFVRQYEIQVANVLPLYSNSTDILLTYLTPVYGILFFYLSYKFWMRGAYKYSGTGS